MLAAPGLVLGLASACGGDEFAGGDDVEQEGGGPGQGPAPQGGSAAAGEPATAGESGSVSQGGKAGASAGTSGSAGTPTAGAGGSIAGSGGGPTGGASGAGGTSGGMGGSGNMGPCFGKQDAECLDCCGVIAPFDAYLDRSYECACSEPCYALCEENCNTPTLRSLACHRCTIDGLSENTTNLCKPNFTACEQDPACKTVTDCLRSCL
jgi:hypothetical protein